VDFQQALNLGFGATTGVSAETGVQVSSTANNFVIQNVGWEDNTTRVIFTGYLTVIPGTGATGVTLRIREGNTVGSGSAVLATSITGLVAGNTYNIGFSKADFNGNWGRVPNPPGAQWTVSIQQTGAPSAAGSCPDGFVAVLVG
jgi:hypothetical protein